MFFTVFQHYATTNLGGPRNGGHILDDGRWQGGQNENGYGEVAQLVEHVLSILVKESSSNVFYCFWVAVVVGSSPTLPTKLKKYTWDSGVIGVLAGLKIRRSPFDSAGSHLMW